MSALIDVMNTQIKLLIRFFYQQFLPSLLDTYSMTTKIPFL
jgi:hypothetical protein